MEVEKITLSLTSTTLQKQERASLKISILPESAINEPITFSSSNPQVVSVDTKGNLVAIRSGTVTITAKAQNGVTGSIKVTVYTPVTGLVTREDEIILQVGQTYQITPIVSPEDADNPKVDFVSQNSNIASVDTSGIVKAIKEGNTKIKMTIAEGEFTKEVEVTVIPKLPEGSLEISEELTVVGNQISGFQEKQVTVDTLLQKITTTYTIEIQDYNGKTLTGSDLVGTGSTVKILNGQELLIEYVIILYGDVNGDGRINSVDLLVLQRHLLEIKPLTSVFLKAGNLDKTGKRPSSVDLLRIQRHILGLQAIVQKAGEIKEGTIKLEAQDSQVEMGEEIIIKVNTENMPIAACNIEIYFDTNQLEIVDRPENSNVMEGEVLYNWYDEKAENKEASSNLTEFTFRAKQKGISTIVMEGEFFNEEQVEVKPVIEPLEISVGQEENSSLAEEQELKQEIKERSTSLDENNANLAALHLKQEGLSPDFQNTIKEYYIIVGNDVEKLDITAIPENKESAITIEGNENFKNGLNTVTIKVTSANKQKEGIYQIYVTKTDDLESANANLQTLAIENTVLSPELQKQFTHYTTSVVNEITNLNILAVPEEEEATVKITGKDGLKEGENLVTIEVYAPNGITFRKYYVLVTRQTLAQMEQEAVRMEENKEQLEVIESQLSETEKETPQAGLNMDNSKEANEAEIEVREVETKNGIWMIIGTFAFLIVIGIVVILIRRKKKKKV